MEVTMFEAFESPKGERALWYIIGFWALYLVAQIVRAAYIHGA